MFERTWTVMLPTGSGPAVYPIETQLPGGNPRLFIEAWGQANALILGERMDLPEATQRISSAGNVDALMVVGTLSGRRWQGSGYITVFFTAANASGAPQFVTVKVRQLAN